jgi:hypothetical protein
MMFSQTFCLYFKVETLAVGMSNYDAKKFLFLAANRGADQRRGRREQVFHKRPLFGVLCKK